MKLFHQRDRSLQQRLGFGVPPLAAIEQREIVQRRRDIAMNRTMGLFHVRQQALRQRNRFGIFAGPAEFGDLRAARRRVGFLRQRWRVKASAGRQRQSQ